MRTQILIRNFNKVESDFNENNLQEILSMSRAEIISTVRIAHLQEHGLFSQRIVGDEWKNHFEFSKGSGVVSGFNNFDYNGALFNLLEKDSLSVLEGLAIAVYAVGDSKGSLYIPQAHESALDSLESAAHKLNELECLKKLGISISVAVGSIDVRSLKKEQVVHHIGTLASISALFRLKKDFVPTRIVLFDGDVKVPGIVEIPIGLTLQTLIDEFAGGVEESLKAVAISEKLVDASGTKMVVDESFSLGNGVITIYNNKRCMADKAKAILRLVFEASCGKCTFCREGTFQLYQIFMDISNGKGKPTDLGMVDELGKAMTTGSLCSTGQTASEFALGTLNNFRDELESHIRRKRCPAEVCTAFMNIYVSPELCNGCTSCKEVCDAKAIEGKEGYIHMIDEFECTKCGKCIPICEKGAILRTTGKVPPLPERLTRVGSFKKRR
ncbi:NADH-ubiquinone oxidoreductase-F iron-sulfur binding region domain-containing protein [Desulfosporosinus fructosivorans]